MNVPILDIDLDLPPEERWGELAAYRAAARELMEQYTREIGDAHELAGLLTTYAEAFLDKEHLAELRAVAAILERPEPEVLLANLYYDALKHAFGCTAFAVDTDDGPLHARNLDWPTDDDALARHTLVLRYLRGGEVRYLVAGWPGYIGCLSGLAPGRFSVTLNTVCSTDPPEFRPPISLLLRKALEEARDFDEAVKLLAETEVASDSLLLVTGTRAGEMVVVERSPLRFALRGPEDGRLVVTNDYRALDQEAETLSDELARTSCGRFERARELAASGSHLTADDAFRILDDERVRMLITVQQMVLSARRGELDVRIPARKPSKR